MGTTAEGFAILTLEEFPWGLFSIQLLFTVCCLFEQPGLLLNDEKLVTVPPFIILIKINQELLIIIIQ